MFWISFGFLDNDTMDPVIHHEPQGSERIDQTIEDGMAALAAADPANNAHPTAILSDLEIPPEALGGPENPKTAEWTTLFGGKQVLMRVTLARNENESNEDWETRFQAAVAAAKKEFPPLGS